MWKRKWLIMVATLAVFLSVGAVAWAATGEAPATAPAVAAGTEGTVTDMAACKDDCGEAGRPVAALRKAFVERREQWVGRHKQLMDALRDDMTPEDRALYDQLVETAEQQRQALQEARSDLTGTLKQLRDLADKYLDDES
jgi:hypothetical protein